MNAVELLPLVRDFGVIAILVFLVLEFRAGRLLPSKVVDDYIKKYSIAVTGQVDKLCQQVALLIVEIEANSTARRDCEFANMLADQLKEALTNGQEEVGPGR